MEKTKSLLTLILAATLATILISCTKPGSKTEIPKEMSIQQRGEQMWFFIMDKSKEEELFHNVAHLSLGDTVDDVTSSLGPPTYDQQMAGKQSNEILFRVLSYYVRKRDRELANNNDQVLRIYFDKNNHLNMIESNVDGHLIKIGSLPSFQR